MVRTNIVLALALALPVGMTTGCRPATAGPAPTVSQQTGTILSDFASTVQEAQQVEIAAHNAQLIDNKTHITIQHAFDLVARDQAAVASALNNATGPADATTKINALIGDINGALNAGLLGISDPTTRARVTALSQTLGSLATQLLVTVQQHQTGV